MTRRRMDFCQTCSLISMGTSLNKLAVPISIAKNMTGRYLILQMTLRSGRTITKPLL